MRSILSHLFSSIFSFLIVINQSKWLAWNAHVRWSIFFLNLIRWIHHIDDSNYLEARHASNQWKFLKTALEMSLIIFISVTNECSKYYQDIHRKSIHHPPILFLIVSSKLKVQMLIHFPPHCNEKLLSKLHCSSVLGFFYFSNIFSILLCPHNLLHIKYIEYISTIIGNFIDLYISIHIIES